MHIKGKDAPDSARTTANRPPTVGPLTPSREAGSSPLNLALSRTGRVMAEALARVVPGAGGLRVAQLLTAGDHAMLALASELVEASGLSAEQLRKLVDDLAAHRLAARTAPQPGGARGRQRASSSRPTDAGSPLAPRPTRSEGAAASARGGFLTLRAFGVRDEALARDILRSPAVRSGVIDRGFVTALLDPDAGTAPTVDLGFLRQLAGALTPSPAATSPQPAAEVSSMIARRDARGFLARALSALALPTEGIADVTPDRAVHGDTLLRARMPSLLDRLGAWLGTRTPSSASAPAQSAPGGARGDVAPPAWIAAAGEAVPAPRPALTRGTRSAQRGAPASQERAPTPSSPQRGGAGAPLARDPLTRDDRSLLRLLYAAAAARGSDLHGVDDVAAALVTFRQAERAEASRVAVAPSKPEQARPTQPEETAPRASIAPRATGEARTYEPPRSFPPARPLALGAPRAALPSGPPSAEAALVAHDVPGSARSYGSSTQMAARLASSYGRLAPPSVAPPPMATADFVAREAATRAVALLREPGAALPYAGTLPLDLGQALGLGALFTEVQRVTARSRRQRRRKKRQQLMRAIGALRHAPRPSEHASREDVSSRRARRLRARAR